MVVRDHGPEATQGHGGRAEAKLRHVAFEKGLDEVLAPLQAGAFVRGQEGVRKGAALPERAQGGKPHFVEGETAHIDEMDATGQGLGSVPHQVG